MTTPDDETIPVHRVLLHLCVLCLDGAGGECHTPGCSLWMHAAPDIPVRDSQGVTVYEAADASPSDPVTRLRLIADQDIGGNAPWLADELHAFADRLAAEMRGESQAPPSISIAYDLPPIAPGRLPAPQLAEKWANRDDTQERTEEGQ